MGLSPRLLLKSSFGSGGSARSASPSPSTNSSHSSLNGAGSSPRHTHSSNSNNSSRVGPSPIATHSYGLFASSSFSSTQSADSYGCVAAQQQQQQKSAGDVLRIVSEEKLCVVRKYGAQEETLVSSTVDGMGRAAGVTPLYLHVSQQTAGRILDYVNRNGLPLIFLNGNAVGGLGELRALEKSGFVAEALRARTYDLVVVGGGAVGIAAAREAALLGKKVVLIDHTVSDEHNDAISNSLSDERANCTRPRSLGAHCANAGVLPKRLLHEMATFAEKNKCLGEHRTSSSSSSSQDESSPPPIDWHKMADAIHAEVEEVGASRCAQLDQSQVEVIEARAVLTGHHEVCAERADGSRRSICADKILVAVGRRATRPRFPGEDAATARQFHITADEFFALKRQNPGRTLCVGNADHLSFEIAGILNAFGNEVTILEEDSKNERRDVILDAEFSQRIRKDLAIRGVKFCRGRIVNVNTVQCTSTVHTVTVLFEEVAQNGERLQYEGEFDTIISALSYSSAELTASLNLAAFGAKLTRTGAVETRCGQAVGALPNLYAVGNCAHDNTQEANGARENCAASAAKEARELMRRLFTGSSVTVDCSCTPTVILTPIPYAECGLSEKFAVAKHGAEHIAIYESTFCDNSAICKSENVCKIVCLLSEQERIIGAQILAPDAPLLIDALAMALHVEARKSQLDAFISANSALSQMLENLSIESPKCVVDRKPPSSTSSIAAINRAKIFA